MLTQEQLNAAVIIRALADIGSVNTDPRYGGGRETLALVRAHTRQWDYHNLIEIRDTLDRVFAPAPAADAVNPQAGSTGMLSTRDKGSDRTSPEGGR